jgi:BirA family biotin operon repressor/biotin-[acetyl-CoA-carboxylase] ligase
VSDPGSPEAGAPVSDWAAAGRPGRRVGSRIEFHPEIGSTNDRARAALADPASDGLAVVADRQLAGRGRMGRTWISPAGVNLLLSVGLGLDLPAERAWWLAAGAALAMRSAAQSAVGAVGAAAGLAIRWPNDLVTADGLKVAGLLVETEVEGGRAVTVVIGMGLNVNWRRADMPSDIAAGATSLADLAGGPIDRVKLLAGLLAALDDEVSRIEDGTSPQVRFQSASWLTGREIEIETPAGRLTGVAGAITDTGGLVLDGPTIQTTVNVGEVIRVHAQAA